MTFDEAIESSPGYGLGEAATVNGFLVVSESVVYLCASETDHGQAILVVAPWLLHAISNELSISVGTMRLFDGPATLTGHLVESGLGLFRLALYGVSTVTLSQTGRTVVVRA